MTRIEKARQLRKSAALSAQTATDGQALTMPTMYDYWAAGVSYSSEGQPSIVRRVIDGVDWLYRCRQPHTSQADWMPENTPAMWVVINNQNAGTVDDPIPAARGMEYTYGLYYLDGEDGNTYLCKRTGEAEGGTIVLQFLPHELVGQYFDAVV